MHRRSPIAGDDFALSIDLQTCPITGSCCLDAARQWLALRPWEEIGAEACLPDQLTSPGNAVEEAQRRVEDLTWGMEVGTE